MDPVEMARDVVDTNFYMTLGTADAAGRPWVSPVYFAAAGYRDFYWASVPEAVHSRNLAVRAELSIVIFNSQVPVNQGRAVYLEAVGAEVAAGDLDAGIAIYNRPAAARGASIFGRTDLQAPARHRLYRATAVRQYLLDGSDQRIPVRLG
ncbi:pyridoxamine 5'-phosphate oxidase family protein [Actinoplanes sp. NPDC024001]|uniref:pyridoxamine 5'-phosphate oxidase family protein n=1 Tax=Actinoplanes sp. NPDC024001 TaxID=3154598 RepID=UPI0033F5503B